MSDISNLKFDNKNFNKHTRKGMSALEKSLRNYGAGRSILVDKDNNIIAGNGIVEAAGQIGIIKTKVIETTGDEIVVVKRTDVKLDSKKGREMAIADNATAAMDLEWDEENLKEETKKWGIDTEEWGVEATWGDEQEIVEHEVPEAPEEPKSKLGDIYQLGNHRLMCGDSTKEEDVTKLMGGETADMVFTDPPYGMNAVTKSGVLSKNYKTDILGDDSNDVAIRSFALASSVFNNAKQVWWGANYYTECLPGSECWIVWDKNNGDSDQTDCELAWSNFRSVVRQFTLASEKTNRVHPTQKPVKLITDIIRRFEKDSKFLKIIDLFGGSGSTLIACEQLNRKCYMMELDPRYVDVIIQRWENFTGEKAVKIV